MPRPAPLVAPATRATLPFKLGMKQPPDNPTVEEPIYKCPFIYCQVEIVNEGAFIYIGGMSPRPRVTSDAAILEATARAIGRMGPTRLTLADVAEEAGGAPATLLQSIGSPSRL